MSDLTVSTADLRAAGSNLRYVATEFEHAERITEDYGSMVGHRRLASRLEDFAGNWDDTRNEMLESIKTLAEVATKAGEMYEELEREFVKALTEGGS
jgi:hypothetical protein